MPIFAFFKKKMPFSRFILRGTQPNKIGFAGLETPLIVDFGLETENSDAVLGLGFVGCLGKTSVDRESPVKSAGDRKAAAFTLVLPYGATVDPSVKQECTRLGVNFYISYAFIGQNGEVVFSNPKRQNNLIAEEGSSPSKLEKGAILDLSKATIYWRDTNQRNKINDDSNDSLNGTE